MIVGMLSSMTLWGSHDLMQRASAAYQQGNMQGALDAYRAITKKRPVVWYNMGNCYYHMHELVPAILSWQRALPGSSYATYCAAQEQIAAAQRQLGIQETHHVPLFLSGIAHLIPVGVMQILFLLCWLCLWLCIRYRYQLPFSNGLIFGILVIAIFGAVVVYLQWSADRYEQAVVIQKDMVLYAGPDEKYDAVGAVAQGSTIALVQKVPGWYKIAYDERYGWVMASAIESIKTS